MGETRKVRKGDGSTTVMRGGRIIGNLPGSSAAPPPTDAHSSGYTGARDVESGYSLESLHSAFRAQTREEMLTEAKRDFDNWVTAAAFAEEGDSSRGRFWEGAAQYASTPEGAEALERIASNHATTETLRTAALALQEEVARNADVIHGTWTPEIVDQAVYTEPELIAHIGPDARVHSRARMNLSGETRVLGYSSIDDGCVTFGKVSIDNANLVAAHISHESEITNSSVAHAMVRGSTIRDGSVTDLDRTSTELAHYKTTVINSQILEGGAVTGAYVEESTVEGSVVGTGTRGAQLYNRENVTTLYSYDGWGSTHASPDIGVRAEKATYAQVRRSTVGRGATVENAVIADSRVTDGGSVCFATVRNATISGSARVAGTFEHRLDNLSGYKYLKVITPIDRRSLVENVTLTREYVGPSAEVTHPRHVHCIAKGGSLYTRYRTSRKGAGPFRRSWGYTKVSVDPSDGSLRHEFLGFSGKSENDAVRDADRLFG